MGKGILIQSEVLEGEAYVTVARVVGANGAVVLSSGVTDWELRVYDESSTTPTTSLYTLTGQLASLVMQTALVVDGYWTVDATGYTFRHSLSAAAFTAQGGGVYRLEYKINTPLWGMIPVVNRVRVLALGSV